MRYSDTENLFIHRKYEPVKEPRPSGFTVTETICSIVILGSMLVFMVTSFRLVDLQARKTDLHQVALNEASNIMERLAAKQWNELTPDRVGKNSISSSTLNRIPDASLKTEINQPDKTPEAKKISVRITYSQSNGQPAPAVLLTSWVYQQESAE